MFDTVLGLPVHALVVHGVVVLLPLMAGLTVAAAFVPRLRWAAWWVVGANAAVLAMTFVARQSGAALQARLGGQVAVEHGDIGSRLPWFALALLVASVLVAVSRAAGRTLPAGVLALVAAAAALFWAVRTGHSGSEAVWAEIVRNTKAP